MQQLELARLLVQLQELVLVPEQLLLGLVLELEQRQLEQRQLLELVLVRVQQLQQR